MFSILRLRFGKKPLQKVQVFLGGIVLLLVLSS